MFYGVQGGIGNNPFKDLFKKQAGGKISQKSDSTACKRQYTKGS